MLLAHPVDFFLPTPVHLLVILAALVVVAFRSPHARWRRWRFPLLVVFAWMWIMATPAIAHALAHELETRFAPADVPAGAHPSIIVLASGQAWEADLPGRFQLDDASLNRTLAGVDAWRKGGGTLIFAGRVWRYESVPVSERMAALAREMGVPPEALRAETESLSTYENLRNVQPMLSPDAPVYLVTSAMHMPRAMAVAAALGIEARPLPCDFRGKRAVSWRAWLPNSRALPLMSWVLHEHAARLYYRLRGWI